MKLEVVLKPCPWCRKTPDIYMPIPDETWMWRIRCNNPDCNMRPQSPYVSFRKTSKTNCLNFYGKLCDLALKWNAGNPFRPTDYKEIDITKIAVDESWDLLNIIDFKRIIEGCN